MCGIAGVIAKDSEIDRELFEQMTDMVSHRGPDDRGTWYNDHVALGHRRLSILDLSEAGHQPFVYKERYIVVYNGEIYNYIELKEELKGQGYEFRTTCDTEILVAAYDCWGENCTEHFNGMWGFAIYDTVKQTVFCSRDRYGVKPFYYSESGDLFIFGSEIKQILHMADRQVYANKERLLRYLYYGELDRSEETMFDGVYQLLPGESLILDVPAHTYRKMRYYDLYDHIHCRKDAGSYRQAAAAFWDNYRSAVELRLRSDVTLGFCFSAGLDSPANACQAHHPDKDLRQETVTYCSEYEEYDEQEYADVISDHVGCNTHKTYSDAADLLSELDKVIWHNDEPFGSTAVFASWCTFKEAAANGLKVMIDGQGADELMAGYIMYFPTYFISLLKKGRIIKYCKEVFWYYYRRLKPKSYMSLQDIVVKPFKMTFTGRKNLQDDIRKKNAEDGSSPFTVEQIDHLYDYSDANIYDDLDRFVDEDFASLLPLLHYEDRNTMAHSIESRLPFLDYRMVDSIGAMPITYKIRRGMTKAVMREALKGVLPEKVRMRVSKFGFVTPEDKWINSNVDMFEEEMTKAARILSDNHILDHDRVISWWNAEKGKVRRGYRLPWRIVCAAHWFEVFDVKVRDA